MTTLFVTRGLPGSGKSTWAASVQEERPDEVVVVNRDDTRMRLFGSCGPDYYDAENLRDKEELVTVATHAEITAALKAGFGVICSDTNLPVKRCRELRRLATAQGADFAIADFSDVPLEVCLERNANRRDKEPVPESVIRTMWERYIRGGLHPVPDEEEQDFSAMIPQGQFDIKKRVAFIVDIDGTLAHIPEGGRSPYDYSRVMDDELDDSVATVVNALFRGVDIFIVSGRKSECREETEQWLERAGVNYDRLYMRADDDDRADWKVKYDLFNEHIRPTHWVEGVIDDRVQVLRMWEQIGLKTFRVGGLEGGNF